MLDLTDVKNIKSILAQQGLSPQKKLGQHFLIDKRVLQKLLAAAGVSSSNIVAEVGAGVGTITVELAKRAEKVYAVEIDKNLIPILKSQINDFKNVNIINTDILHLLQGWSLRNHNLREKAIQQVLQGWSLQDLKIIGAIPYQITSPLIHHLLTQENPPCLIAIIVQKEVAEKITAQPPKATYLSNFVSFFGNAEVVGKPIPP
ncbi:MAG: 16S rRNA (adenine(1518)-N(6)/adenine(1519)-N(6))-dimethyltransferase, partial [Candidatus Cloacimonetes bacterium]|nr:16S rRNA (adenine(1518)-N(6)/adenine(1519)-N(6))-dimethyltransferase [Candidatus Cloacimonadota bacterium]